MNSNLKNLMAGMSMTSLMAAAVFSGWQMKNSGKNKMQLLEEKKTESAIIQSADVLVVKSR